MYLAPIKIPAGETVAVNSTEQLLFSHLIEISGTLVVDGLLIQVV